MDAVISSVWDMVFAWREMAMMACISGIGDMGGGRFENCSPTDGY